MITNAIMKIPLIVHSLKRPKYHWYVYSSHFDIYMYIYNHYSFFHHNCLKSYWSGHIKVLSVFKYRFLDKLGQTTEIRLHLAAGSVTSNKMHNLNCSARLSSLKVLFCSPAKKTTNQLNSS